MLSWCVRKEGLEEAKGPGEQASTGPVLRGRNSRGERKKKGVENLRGEKPKNCIRGGKDEGNWRKGHDCSFFLTGSHFSGVNK